MRQWKTRAALSVGALAAGLVLAPHAARAQAVTYDHLTCANISKDDRLAQMPPPLRLEPEQAAFLESNGCKIVGGNKVARAKEVCYASAKSPNGPPGGLDLSGQSFLCYRVKCAPNAGGRTPVNLTDQFGSGNVTVNQQPPMRKLCVPAFPPGTPTPTPTVTPTATPTPIVTPTPPYGSASRAFVKPVGSLLQ